MNNLIPLFITLLFLTACNANTEEKGNQTIDRSHSTADTAKLKENASTIETGYHISDFVPKGYVIYKEEGMEEITGDLNQDGLADIVFLIKGTETSKIIQHEYRGKLDRNRRGIIILFNKGKYYKLASKNYDCFSSENEDGGVYFAPILSLYVEKGNLNIHYSHGRYGGWKYTFRYQNGDFELIGYDQSTNHGPVILGETSINFLTKKKLSRENLNQDIFEDNHVENFKDTLETIDVKSLIRLSEIKDIDKIAF